MIRPSRFDRIHRAGRNQSRRLNWRASVSSTQTWRWLYTRQVSATTTCLSYLLHEWYYTKQSHNGIKTEAAFMRDKSAFSDLSGIEESTSQLPLVGYTVFWRLAGIRVALPELSQAMAATGFSKYLPDPPTPRVALRRALAQWIKEKELLARVNQTEVDEESEEEENSGLRRRTLIRVINRSGSDASPLHYLARIGEVHILPALYGRIIIRKRFSMNSNSRQPRSQ
jgi:hypothetical protein